MALIIKANDVLVKAVAQTLTDDQKNQASTNIGLAKAVVGLSVSGTTITYTNKDGTTGTIQTQDTTNFLPINGGTLKGGVNEAIINLTGTSGTITLTSNRIHKISINGATTFNLPSISDLNNSYQIKVMAYVSGTHSINWGTSNFFNRKVPEIKQGYYDFYFDYDPVYKQWIAGAIPKGVQS